MLFFLRIATLFYFLRGIGNKIALTQLCNSSNTPRIACGYRTRVRCASYVSYIRSVFLSGSVMRILRVSHSSLRAPPISLER